LCEFFRACWIVEPPPEESVNRVAIALEQLAKRVARAFLKLQNQLVVAAHRLPGLRCHLTERFLRLSFIRVHTFRMSRTAKKFPQMLMNKPNESVGGGGLRSRARQRNGCIDVRV